MLVTALNLIQYGDKQTAQPNTVVDLDDETAEYVKSQGAARDPTEAENALYEQMKPAPAADTTKNPKPVTKPTVGPGETKPDDVVG